MTIWQKLRLPIYFFQRLIMAFPDTPGLIRYTISTYLLHLFWLCEDSTSTNYCASTHTSWVAIQECGKRRPGTWLLQLAGDLSLHTPRKYHCNKRAYSGTAIQHTPVVWPTASVFNIKATISCYWFELIHRLTNTASVQWTEICIRSMHFYIVPPHPVPLACFRHLGFCTVRGTCSTSTRFSTDSLALLLYAPFPSYTTFSVHKVGSCILKRFTV